MPDPLDPTPTPTPTPTSDLAGPSAHALASLTPAQLHFLHALPKAELHAHLNGSIPLDVLRELAGAYLASRADESGCTSAGAGAGGAGGSGSGGSDTASADDSILETIRKLEQGPVVLDEITDFFALFPAIYQLTSTPAALRIATRGVLRSFLGPPPSSFSSSTPTSTSTSTSTLTPTPSPSPAPAQCTYLELRSTPRTTRTLTPTQYTLCILAELELYPPSCCALILSLDRRMSLPTLRACVSLACELRRAGRRVVGVDLCGDPRAGDVGVLGELLEEARAAGLGVTLHIAETPLNTPEESLRLLSYAPDRLGHATFLTPEAMEIVKARRTCIEICLSSNLLCKTVPSLEAHHIHQYLASNHPICICTDDTLPFRTSLMAEYALLLAQPPLGLGLSEEDVRRVAGMSLEARFRV